MKHASLLCVVLWMTLDVIVCPPITEKPQTPKPPVENEEDVVSQLAYEKYLREVMSVLMSDEQFAKKMMDSGQSVSEKSGEIAKHLDFVGHNIRTRLDEIKRKEIDRLRQIMRLHSNLQNGMKMPGRMNIPPINLPSVDKEKFLAHLDHNNPNSFEIEDLSKLIKQATRDLEEIDVKRRTEFKEYEMEKEHLRREELKKLDEKHRQEEEEKFRQMQKKHGDHPEVNHPGNEDQLKEVWEETDGLNKKEFNPKTFFHLHDTNGDGLLDEPEIEALFQNELDKVYDPNAPEDDMMERYEEMNRMREHVMNEVDKNKDKLVSLEEFLESTEKEEFKKDEDWETLDKKPVYTEEELAQFEREYEEEQRREHEEQDTGAEDHLQAGEHHEVVNEMHQQGGQQQQHHDTNEIPQRGDVNSDQDLAHQPQPVVHQQQIQEHHEPVQQQHHEPAQQQQQVAQEIVEQAHDVIQQAQEHHAQQQQPHHGGEQ